MIFRLHYRATVAVLLAGCLTLACKSISGSPIHCEATAAVDKAVLETFCWLHTTYSMVRAFNMSIGQAVPYPGVSNTKGEGGHGHAPHPLVKQHKYYQWVIFLLLLQVRSDRLFSSLASLSTFLFSIVFSLPLLYNYILLCSNCSTTGLRNIENVHDKYYFSFSLHEISFRRTTTLRLSIDI